MGGAWSSPQELVAGSHGVDDHDGGRALDPADLEDDRGPFRTDQRGEGVFEIPRAQRIAIRVEDLILGESILQWGLDDDRIVHGFQVTLTTRKWKCSW